MMPFPSDLQLYFANLGDPSYEKTNVMIEYEVEDTSARFECTAVNKMNNLSETSPEAAWWNFIAGFTGADSVTKVNLLERFPGLQEWVDESVFDDNQTAIVQSLAKTHGGKVFGTGGPGTAKSFFAMMLTAAILQSREAKQSFLRERPRKQTAIGLVPVGSASSANTVNTSVPSSSKGKERAAEPPVLVTDSSNPFVPSSSSGGKGRAAEPPALVTNTTDAVNLADELAVSDSEESSNGNLVFVHGTKWAQLDAEAEVERQAIPVFNIERIAWTAPQNTQVDDAVRRLRQRMPSICIVRIYPYKHELSNMVTPHSPPELLSLDDARPNDKLCLGSITSRQTVTMSAILPLISIPCQHKQGRWFVRILMNSQP